MVWLDQVAKALVEPQQSQKRQSSLEPTWLLIAASGFGNLWTTVATMWEKLYLGLRKQQACKLEAHLKPMEH
jgi:hypothetical protein